MNYRMWHFRGEYIFENTIVRMQIAICDDEKSIGLILEGKNGMETARILRQKDDEVDVAA